MAHDRHRETLKAKYGTTVHPRLRDGLLEAVDGLAERLNLTRNQTVELAIARGAKALAEEP